MAAPQKYKLDAELIAALRLPDDREEQTIWDSEIVGFGLRLRRRVDGGMQRTFILQYRNNAGRTRKYSFHGELPLAQVRKAAQRLWAEIKLGGDPQARRKAQRRSTGRALVEASVSLQAALRRINRELASRPAVDVERLAHRLGALRPWETIG